METLFLWEHYSSSEQTKLACKYINEQRITEGVQHKLLIKLLSYDYKIEYKRSKENKAADALSRVPPNGQLFATTLIIPTWITDVVDSYATDTKCQELESQLRINPQAHLSRPKTTLKIYSLKLCLE